MPSETVTHQARTLSDGTYGTLTGLRRYDELDKVRERFIQFCESHEMSGTFKTWQGAWRVFKETLQDHGDPDPGPRPQQNPDRGEAEKARWLPIYGA